MSFAPLELREDAGQAPEIEDEPMRSGGGRARRVPGGAGGGDGAVLHDTFLHFADLQLDARDPHTLLASANAKANAITLAANNGVGGALDDLRARLAEGVGREEGELEIARADALGQLDDKLAAEIAALDASGQRGSAELSRSGAAAAGWTEILSNLTQVEIADGRTAQLDRLSGALSTEKGRVATHAESDRDRMSSARQTARVVADGHSQTQLMGLGGASGFATQLATAEGKEHAEEVRAAAKQRASEVTDPAARAAILAEGEARATRAIATAKRRADETSAHAQTQIGEAGKRRDARHDVQDEKLGRGEAELGETSQKADADLDARLRAATGAGQLDEATTHAAGGRIAAEQAKVEATRRAQDVAFAQRVVEERAKLRAEHTKAKAAIEAEHQKRLGAVRERARRATAALAAGGDLDGLGRMLETTLSALDAQSDEVVATHRGTVGAGGRKLTQLRAKQVGQLAAAARQALATLETVAKAAERQINAEADKELRRQKTLAGAALQDLRHVADAAISKNRRGTIAVEKAIEAQSAVDTGAAAAEAKGVLRAMGVIEASTEDVGKELETEMAREAAEKATRVLVPGVRPEGAIAALDSLLGLPPPEQGAAVAALDPAVLGRLVDTLPDARKRELLALYEHTTDPARKLTLWKTVAEEKMTRSLDSAIAEADRELAGDELTARRTKIGEIRWDANMEIADEAHFLADKLARGERVTAADVEALAARKDKELALEIKYGVNLTNQKGGTDVIGKPTPRTHWSEEELALVDSGLSRLPKEHVDLVKQITRAKAHMTQDMASLGTWVENPKVGGITFAGGKITMFDAAGDASVAGHESELSHHHPDRAPPHGPATPFEQTLVHEVGHVVAEKLDDPARSDDAYDQFGKAADWRHHQNEEQMVQAMVAAGMTEAKARAEARRVLANPWPHAHVVRQGDRRFNSGHYGEGGWSTDEGAIPDPGFGSWGYANTTPGEHFAELYSMAVNTPEQLHHAMVVAPKQVLGYKQQALAAAEEKLVRVTTPQARALAETKVREAQAAVAEAEEVIRQRGEQAHILRSDVFHGDAATFVAGMQLRFQDVPPAKRAEADAIIAAFQKDAEVAFTPDHVMVLRDKAREELAKLTP
jgi:hypothetical protein